jgi:heme/copper-type cytochrome/quinol oxidase subunit 4
VADVDTAWAPEIFERLREWQSRAADTAELHYGRAFSLERRVAALGVSAVILSAAGAIWLIGVSGSSGPIVWIVGALTAGAAAVAACLHTFPRYGEQAEEHRQIAERWAELQREIDEIVAVHPQDLTGRRDPESYVADLRARIEDASAKSRWREITAQQRLEFRAATIATAGKRAKPLPRLAERSRSLFTAAVRNLLEDWERRAAASSDAHVGVGQRFASLNVRLGAPTVVVLATEAAFLLVLRDSTPPSSRVALGTMSALAAILVALNTFLHTTERAAKHGIAAERWATLRGEIADVIRDPTGRAQEDPQAYLDDLRTRMDEMSVASPEVGDRVWAQALAGDARRPTVSTTAAAERFASVFPGVNLRVEDDAVGVAS